MIVVTYNRKQEQDAQLYVRQR